MELKRITLKDLQTTESNILDTLATLCIETMRRRGYASELVTMKQKAEAYDNMMRKMDNETDSIE